MSFGILWNTPTKNHFGYSLESAINEEGIAVDEDGNEIDLAMEMAFIAKEDAEIQAQQDHIQQATVAADVGETIGAVAQKIEERGDATPEEAALIQAGAAQTMVAAGAPEEVTEEVTQGVATESASGIVISTEGFIEVLKSFWQKIKDSVGKILRNIKDIWNRFWNSSAKVLERAQKLVEEVKTYGEAVKEGAKVKFKSFFKDLVVASNGNWDFKKVVDATDELTKLTQGFAKEFKNYATNLNSLTVSKLDKKVVEAYLQRIGIEGTGFANYSKNTLLGDKYTEYSIELPFGRHVAVKGWLKDDSASPAEIINSFTAKIGPAVNINDLPLPKDKEGRDPLNILSVEIIFKNVIATVKALETWYNQDSKKAHDSIESFSKYIDGLIKKDVDEEEEAKNIKAFSRFYVATSRLFSFSVSLCAYIVSTCNKLLTFGQMSMVCHVKKEDKK